MQCFDYYIMKLTHMFYPHTFLDKAHDVIQLNRVTEAAPGDAVTLHCFFPEAFQQETLSWYKQTLGQKPFLIIRSFKATPFWNPLFSEDFKNGRINIKQSKGTFNLTITNVTSSDEATYYCIGGLIPYLTFGNGTFLALKGNTRRSTEHPNNSGVLRHFTHFCIYYCL